MYTLDDFAIVWDSWEEAAIPQTTRVSLALSWSAMGESESARWAEVGSGDDLWQWVNRLGRGFDVYDPFGAWIWGGYVHGVRVRVGRRELAFSLDQLANRVMVVYSYVNYLCPTSGDFKIAGAPSGSVVGYDDGAGGDPAGEGDLAALTGGTALYNVTQEDEATIQSVDSTADTITLTAAVPGSWNDNDDLRYGSVMGRDVTSWADDSDSQDRYGIKERVASRAGMTATAAENERDSLLDLWAWPLGEYGGGRSSRRGDQVQIEALGWWARCRWRIWHWETRGQLSAADQVKLMRSEKLDFLSSDESLIDDIGHSTTQYRDDYQDVQREILALAEMGDETTGARALAGVARDKKLFLRLAETGDQFKWLGGSEWFNAAGQRVLPWQVRPDGYVVVKDLVPATAVLAAVADVSKFYLERVEWEYPDKVMPTPLGGRDLAALINAGVQV